MRVCFVLNHEKSHVFFALIKTMRERFPGKYEFFLISISPKFNALATEMVGRDNYLYIPFSHREKCTKARSFDVGYNELVAGDRVLSTAHTKGLDFLINFTAVVYDFLVVQKINFVFGELTWAHEVATHRLIKAYLSDTCIYLNPHTIRLPPGMFAFFEDEFQSVIRTSGAFKTVCVENNEAKPDYMLRNDHAQWEDPLGSSTRLQRILKRIFLPQEDPTISSGLAALREYCQIYVNRWTYAVFSRLCVSSKREVTERFVYYPLHKQPEASIDVVGRYYNNQLENIKRIAHALPLHTKLYVKEHPSAIGCRSLAFYLSVASLPNVRIVHHNVDPKYLVRQALATVTVSGTAAYEAAMLGKQAYTFAPCFFNGLGRCERVTYETLSTRLRYTTLAEAIPYGCDEMSRQRVLVEGVFDGVFSDPRSDSRAISPQNISQLIYAFDQIMSE